jgi:hypothetical protein
MQLQKILAWQAVHRAYRGKSSYDDKNIPPPPPGPPPTDAIKAAIEHRKSIANLLSGANKPVQPGMPKGVRMTKEDWIKKLKEDDMKMRKKEDDAERMRKEEEEKARARRIKKLKEADRLRGQKMQAMERRLYPERFE